MRSNSASPAGFTLVELMVALVVGGIAIVGARGILATLADQTDRVTGIAADLDRIANGERILRALAGGVEIATTPGTGFGGEASEASFTTWCDVAGGWQERCRVRLVVAPADSIGGRHVLAAIVAGGEGIPLLTTPSPMQLLYLGDAANGGTWYPTWARGLSIPLAVGIATADETLIVRIGERG
jgi:prepilin-type N-terminal cleavage/methylation domain-containing protein